MSQSIAYRYRAARGDGAVEIGSLVAESRDAAREAIGRRGLFVVALDAEAAHAANPRRMRLDDAALGLRLLARLLSAGLPIQRALAAFEEIAPRTWATVVPHLKTAIREGRSLEAAFGSAPVQLPPVVVSIIGAGEAGAGLADAVTRAAASAESARRTRGALVSALTYPAILAVAGTASVGLMIGVVLPRFATILSDLGQRLPPTTQFVLAAGGAVRSLLPVAVLAIGLAALVWRSWIARDSNRERWSEALLRAPLVGPVRRSLSTARSMDALSALLTAGVGLASAMPHAAAASGEAFCAAALLRVRERLLRGESLAQAVTHESVLTPTAVRLIRAGEETGRLAVLLDEAAQFERERAEDLVKAAARVIEPAFILLFGGCVALAAAALLQALYGIRPV